MNLIIRILSYSALIFLVWGCAPKVVPVERPAGIVWEQFQAGIKGLEPGQEFLLSASVTYITPTGRNRIQSSIWGTTGYPIRMDISAGFGQTIAMWHEDHELWEAYFPRENTKYIHHDGSIGASMLGYPTPLDLRQTVQVLLGAFEGLVPDNFHRYEPMNGMWRFYFNDHEVKSMVIAQDGTVKSISGHGWNIEFNGLNVDGEHRYYSRIEMNLSQDQRALIRMKSVRTDDLDLNIEQLGLKVPPEAKVVYLPDL
ncbi:MAG: hypothetical protein ABR542_05500 [Desulfonatronovibrio sp.]